MIEPRWLSLEEVIAAQEKQLVRFGGPGGIRDENALASALARPINRWRYEQADLATLAASYAFGLARNHAFLDGNKRIAFVSMMVFLRLNGVRFAPDPAQATTAIIRLASGEIDEAGLTRWIRDNWPTA